MNSMHSRMLSDSSIYSSSSRLDDFMMLCGKMNNSSGFASGLVPPIPKRSFAAFESSLSHNIGERLHDFELTDVRFSPMSERRVLHQLDTSQLSSKDDRFHKTLSTNLPALDVYPNENSEDSDDDVRSFRIDGNSLMCPPSPLVAQRQRAAHGHVEDPIFSSSVLSSPSYDYQHRNLMDEIVAHVHHPIHNIPHVHSVARSIDVSAAKQAIEIDDLESDLDEHAFAIGYLSRHVSPPEAENLPMMCNALKGYRPPPLLTIEDSESEAVLIPHLHMCMGCDACQLPPGVCFLPYSCEEGGFEESEDFFTCNHMEWSYSALEYAMLKSFQMALKMLKDQENTQGLLSHASIANNQNDPDARGDINCREILTIRNKVGASVFRGYPSYDYTQNHLHLNKESISINNCMLNAANQDQTEQQCFVRRSRKSTSIPIANLNFISSNENEPIVAMPIEFNYTHVFDDYICEYDNNNYNNSNSNKNAVNTKNSNFISLSPLCAERERPLMNDTNNCDIICDAQLSLNPIKHTTMTNDEEDLEFEQFQLKKSISQPPGDDYVKARLESMLISNPDHIRESKLNFSSNNVFSPTETLSTNGNFSSLIAGCQLQSSDIVFSSSSCIDRKHDFPFVDLKIKMRSARDHLRSIASLDTADLKSM